MDRKASYHRFHDLLQVMRVGSDNGMTDNDTYCNRRGCYCGLPSNDVARERDVIRIWGRRNDMELRGRQCAVHWGRVNGVPTLPHPAFVLWIGNSRTYLCEDALNNWLDNADDDESLEPKELVFL